MSAAGGNGNGRSEEPGAEHQGQAGSAPENSEREAEASGLEPAPPTRERVETLERELEETKELLLRRRAEFENFRKRSERDQQAAADEAAAAVLRRLLDTVDNLERALVAPEGEGALRKGVELTLRDLLATLDAQGVAVVDPQGERFDPTRHQALLHEAVPGFGAGTVAQVLRKGFLFKDRLLRPALVKVASGDASGESAPPVDDGGGGEVQ